MMLLELLDRLYMGESKLESGIRSPHANFVNIQQRPPSFVAALYLLVCAIIMHFSSLHVC